MKVKLLENGGIAEVEDSWGERLIEQGKAVLPEPEKARVVKAVLAQTTVTDTVPETVDEPKAEGAKKAGKKR